MPVENSIETDVLIIGGGMAGLFAAIKAREEGVGVTLVDKGYVSRSGETCVADGYYALFNPEWGHKLDFWKNEITISGEYMNNPEWTEITLKDSFDRYQDMLSWGAKLNQDKNGELLRMRKRRLNGGIESILLGRGYTFLPYGRVKAEKAGVKIMDRILITDLMKHDGKVIGAFGFHTRSGEIYIFKAKATVISTGGGNFKPEAPALVSNHSYDGESMAYRAGAEISGKEFSLMNGRGMPFYDNTDEKRGNPAPMKGRKVDDSYARYPSWLFHYPPIGIAGNLVDAEGYGSGPFRTHDLMDIHEGRGPLLYDWDYASPDELQRAIQLTGHDMFRLQRLGIDPMKRGLWAGIVRYEHYIGCSYGGSAGIYSTDTYGSTSLPGLFAAGDAYHSAAVGAVYPSGGTGLRNASVTGARSGVAAAQYAKTAGRITPDKAELTRLKKYAFAPLKRAGGFDTTWVSQQIKNVMFPYYVLYVRHGDRLKAALGFIEFLHRHVAPMIYAKDSHGLCLAHETKNRILNAEMILKSALLREESRGAHYREDFPQRKDPDWLAIIKVKLDNGEMKLKKETLPRAWWPDLLLPYEERYPRRYKGEK